VALWNRVAGFDPAELDAALRDQSILKASLMRVTLHAVHAGDHPPFHDAMVGTLRAARLFDRRFTASGLTTADADALVPELIAFASQPRTNAEFEARLRDTLGDLPKPGPWWALRTFAPLVHAPTGGPWSFGPRPSYVAAPVKPRAGEPGASLGWLIRRYLEGFGPATVRDVAQFTLIRVPVIREALASLGGEVIERAGPEGARLFDVPDAPLPAEDTPAPPRLMAMWDSTLLAYADRSRIIPSDYRRLVIRQNGDVLPTLLVDGFVAGVWRPTPDGIEATAFHALSRADWNALEGEARALRTFLADRDPAVYRRYGHWWKTLPSAEVRLLAG
jgi:hypothetical protein